MRDAKVCPVVVMSNWIVDDGRGHNVPYVMLCEENEGDEKHGLGNNYWPAAYNLLPRGREYWEARRAVLSSYHLSRDRTKVTGKLKRFVKEATGVMLEVGRELSMRRLVMRVFRVKMVFPFTVNVCATCFVPAFRKVEHLNYY